MIIHYGLAQRNDLRYENRESSVQKLYKRAEFGELSYPTGSLIASGSLCILIASGSLCHLIAWKAGTAGYRPKEAVARRRRPHSGVLRQG